jgi:hypothetical protein
MEKSQQEDNWDKENNKRKKRSGGKIGNVAHGKRRLGGYLVDEPKVIVLKACCKNDDGRYKKKNRDEKINYQYSNSLTTKRFVAVDSLRQKLLY